MSGLNKLLVPSILSDKYHSAWNVQAADHLISLKEKHQDDIWAVFDGIVEVWESRAPREYDSFIMDTKNTRETRANEFGANKKEGLRYTVDVPDFIINALRMLYTPDELPMDKEFFHEVWKRYPTMRVAEKY